MQELIAQMDTQVSKLALKWASVTLKVYPDTPQKLLRETLQTLREVFPCS